MRPADPRTLLGKLAVPVEYIVELVPGIAVDARLVAPGVEAAEESDEIQSMWVVGDGIGLTQHDLGEALSGVLAASGAGLVTAVRSVLIISVCFDEVSGVFLLLWNESRAYAVPF